MTTSYGSITMIDVTDTGEFSLYPTSNSPLSVIYSADNGSYAPNWGDSNKHLTLTPVVRYGGNSLSLTATGLTITWTKQINSNNPIAISSNNKEYNNNGILSVEQNQFDNNTDMITYICSATYTKAGTQQTLTAQGQITFSLIRQPSSLKKCTITGESAFKYQSNQTTFSPTSITLSADISGNLTGGKWQFKNSNGGWTDFSTLNNTSIRGAEIIVKPNEEGLFINRIATIRKLCSDYVSELNKGTYDIHTIVQLYDGSPGDSTVAAILDNESQTIPCDEDGDPTINLSVIHTTFSVLEGGNLATGWTYDTPSSENNNVEGTWNSETRQWTLTAWNTNDDIATVTFQARKTGMQPLIKYLQLTKVKTGIPGTSPEYYELVCSAVAINKDNEGVFTPGTLSFSANKIVGSTNTKYQGYIAIYENSTSGTDVGGQMTSANTPIVYTPTRSDLTYLTVYLYKNNSQENPVDTQTIVVTADGIPGEGGLNIVLGNSHESLACTNGGLVKTQTEINIPFTGYKGIERKACSITRANITNVPSGCTVGTIINDNGTNSGLIPLTFAEDANPNGNVGEINLSFTIDGTQVPMKFSWSKSFAGKDGSNTVTLQCYARGTNVIENKNNTVTLTSLLLDGSEDKTASSYVWHQWNGTDYVTVRGTTMDLTVQPSWIDGYGAFRCTATYDGNNYMGYVTVTDKTDPLQVIIESTLGEQLINGQGIGAVFVRTILNNEEVDLIKSTNFVTSTQVITQPETNDYCYLINSQNATCTLMQYTGSTWRAVTTDPYDYNYIWTFRNKDGDVTTYNGNTTMSGKALYLGANIVNTKITMTVRVEKKA